MFNTRLSVEEFMRIALAPENADRRLQLIDGEIVEVVSNNQASEISGNLIISIGGFVKPRNLGRITVPDGGYTIEGEQYIPDCAFVSYARQPHSTTEAYPDIAPDLVIEGISPGNLSSSTEREKMFRKIGNYLVLQCQLRWKSERNNRLGSILKRAVEQVAKGGIKQFRPAAGYFQIQDVSIRLFWARSLSLFPANWHCRTISPQVVSSGWFIHMKKNSNVTFKGKPFEPIAMARH